VGSGSFGVVILAAGASTRLGRPKQLLQFRGRSLLRRAAETALDSGASAVVVVLGAQAERLQEELTGLPVTIAINPEWEEGMASSLRAGIGALTTSAAEAAVVMLCDQPLVTAETLRGLFTAQATGGQRAVVSVYADGAPGPPCLFVRALFPELLALRGALGAKQLIARLPEAAVARTPFVGGSCDIDTEADWEQFMANDA